METDFSAAKTRNSNSDFWVPETTKRPRCIMVSDNGSLRRRKQKAIMMFKSLNGLAPVYLQDLFSERHTDYEMRDSLRKLNLPKPRTDYLKRGFGYNGALLWNSLPENIRAIKSIRQFKKNINHALKASDSHSAIL